MKFLVIVFKWLVRLAAAVVRRRRRPASTHLSDTDPDRFKKLLRRDFAKAQRLHSLFLGYAEVDKDGVAGMATWLAFEPVAFKPPDQWRAAFFPADELPRGWVWFGEPCARGEGCVESGE